MPCGRFGSVLGLRVCVCSREEYYFDENIAWPVQDLQVYYDEIVGTAAT